jgi:hypothetical protein
MQTGSHLVVAIHFNASLVQRAKAKASGANVHELHNFCYGYQCLCEALCLVLPEKRVRYEVLIARAEAVLRSFVRTGRLPRVVCH